MNEMLALRVLGGIMKWDREQFRREFQWLSMMAKLKYDDYRGYSPGVRFLESLAYWLQQFRPEDRDAAYRFVRDQLVYVDAPQTQHLIELVYPEVILPRIVRQLATELSTPSYRVWAHRDAERAYKTLRRKCLFMGLSDGARIDAFRRSNEGLITNEQVVVQTEINTEKWTDLLEALRKDLEAPKARFKFIFLLDDFTGSGKTLLRKKPAGTWTGKLFRFWEQTHKRASKLFEKDFVVAVHHYLASERARSENKRIEEEARKELGDKWLPKVDFSYGTVLTDSILVTQERLPDFCKLVDGYYDSSIETPSIRVGGTPAPYGFAACRLPVVLEHNTPNNSVALLWAESAGKDGAHAMRPLFRRAQRHF